MVAMLGRIMPAPLLTPVMFTATPSISMRWLKALGTVSVVMMPSAARAQCAGWASARAAGKPAIRRSTGRVSKITPVENGSTCCGARPRCWARASQVARVRCRPSAPVPALALPVLMTKARICAPACRCSRHTCTGAAQKRFCVNTPATLVPSSSKNTVRSLRLALRIPASATPMRTPRTGCSAAGSRAGRFTGMTGFSLNEGAGSRQLAVALLVLFAAAAGAGVVAPNVDTRRHHAGGHGAGVNGGLHLARLGGCGVGHVGDVLGALFHGLGGGVQLGGRLHAHGHQHAGD